MIVLWAGRRYWGDRGLRFRSGFLIMGVHHRRAQSGLLLGLVHRFWTIVSGILAGFIVLEQLFQSFDLGYSVQTGLLEIPSQRVHQAALVAVELA